MWRSPSGGAGEGSCRRLGARVGAQSAYELGQLAMVLDAPEARGGAEQAEAGPAVNHVADAPALHIARDVAERGDEILDAVRGGEEAAQPGGRSSLSTVSVSSSPSRRL